MGDVAGLNDPNRYEPTGNWSSFSVPVVAGAVGLLIQEAREVPDLSPAVSPDGGNCVIKAILLNSATKLPYWHKGLLGTDDDHTAPLDYVQGAGMLNAVGAYENLLAGISKPGNVPVTGWDLNLLDKIQTPENIYEIHLDEPADKFITATIAWNRHYKTEYPFEPDPEKNCDLRLELWATDPEEPNKIDHSDSNVDNVEHIHIEAKAGYTNYKIIVSFSDIDDPNEPALSQRYAIAWNVQKKQQTDDIFWYDINADGIVNQADFLIMLNNLQNSTKSPGSYLIGDINPPDGAIDVHDLAAILNNNNRQADWLKQQDKGK
jgi:hypothetical protein